MYSVEKKVDCSFTMPRTAAESWTKSSFSPLGWQGINSICVPNQRW